MAGSPQSQAAPPAAVAGATLDPEEILNDDDNDSALGFTDAESDSTSLASSIARYRLENGRTYHAYKEGSYVLPNDEVENERLDLQHHHCLLTLEGKLFISPAGQNNPLNRVLDAGCGTGIWAMDFADEHPESHVVGVDLSPIQPKFVPPNVAFYVDDLEAEWTYSEPFDFIYMRMLSASIRDWPKLFGQVHKNLTPGGYIEMLDPIYPMASDDGTLLPNSPVYRWSKLLNEAAEKLGSGLGSGKRYKQQLIDAGFTNVVETVYKWPMNTWPKDKKLKELGAWGFENISQGLQALSLALFTRALGWDPKELEVFLVEVRKDLRNRNIHAYWPIYVVYGQKPLLEEK